MAPLTGWSSSGNAPADPNTYTQLDGAPLEGARAGLGGCAEAAAPLWENPMFLLVMVLIAMCLLVALAFFIGSRQTKRSLYRNYHSINRRAQLESDFMKSDLFDAASEITKISALYNLKDRRRR